MKKVIRLNEGDLARIVKKVIKENNMCSAEDSKPSNQRPLCAEVSIKSGMLLAMGDMAFIQYNDEKNCPKLCRVENQTTISLA
jgi:hypothetical protein